MPGNDSKFWAVTVSAGGLLTWPSALAIGGYLGISQATVHRILQRLVESNSLHRTMVTGEGLDAWMTTTTTAAAFGRPAATRFLGRGNSGSTWAAGPTLRHDQLALLATFQFARAAAAVDDDDDPTAAPESEIEQQFTTTAGQHIPDGAFIFRGGKCVGVEVELSKKSGSAGGKNPTNWARSLAPSILDRQQSRGTRILALGQAIDTTLLVAPRRLACSIGAAVRREADERGCEPGLVFWCEPHATRLDLGPLKVWQLDNDEPPED